MTVVLKPKTEISVPRSIRRKAGFKVGDRIEFEVANGVITIFPKISNGEDEYTPAERRAIDRGIAQSEKEYREGGSVGPFGTAREFLADLHRAATKLDVKRRNRLHR